MSLAGTHDHRDGLAAETVPEAMPLVHRLRGGQLHRQRELEPVLFRELYDLPIVAEARGALRSSLRNEPRVVGGRNEDAELRGLVLSSSES
ncbi:hypothetical protein LWC35_33540 [Pseudonocardia kujensis]|uniref:hypothetical protein n=1 Tax=Pseudonocardia kujensis TaxID=1128675 RepID=UPI001E2D77E0|nr:hypothetical protein [Pseudonocardia kujensis]MCE0767787.1 hypothetical protein [Pseudonocardia kujensis]